MSIVQRIALLSFVCLLSSSLCSAQSPKPLEEVVTAQLVFGGGFLDRELVSVRIQMGSIDSLVFSGKLDRPMWTQDHSIVRMPMARGKGLTVIIEALDRGVRFEQDYKFYGTLALYVEITPRNQIHVVCSDREFTNLD